MSMKMKVFCAALMSVVSMATMETGAYADEISFKAGGGSQMLKQPSYDAFARENKYAHVAVEVGYASRQRLSIIEPFLLVQTSGDPGTYAQTFNGGLEQDLYAQRVMLGADIGVMVGRFFRPSVRLGGGYLHRKLEVYVPSSSQHYVEHTHDFVGFGEAGGSVIIPLFFGTPANPDSFGARLRLGASAHMGYMAQTTSTFDELEPQLDDETWPVEQVDYGELPAGGGRLFNVGVFVRFRL